ncbi:MAG: hypothetical protein JNL26_01395 [Gemmatimonadetes bacterium]|nr:hypothetical protein [Gemmatimonadota bacterium]
MHAVTRYLGPVAAALVLSTGCVDYERTKQKEAEVRAQRDARNIERKQSGEKKGGRARDDSKLRDVNRSFGEALSRKNEEPFVEMRGYIVRGTDESSFRRCGSSRVYYTRLAPPAAAQVAQRYRFRAASLLSPVYFAVMGRLVDDTVTVGSHTYTAVIEISDILAEKSEGTPDCAPPPRGSMVASR